MIFVMSFIAIKKRVPLSGEPWGMSFFWECTADNLSATRTLNVRLFK